MSDISDFRMSKMGATATTRLTAALSCPTNSHENAKKVLEAIRAGRTVQKTEKMISDLQRLLPQVRRYIARVIEDEGTTTTSESYTLSRALHSELCEDSSLWDSQTFEVEKA
jgi:hypothetical protein